ncbi:MAG: hypothetical protein E7241_01915 [Lachnospiraceae bacterium]|nr:hypothetical protein [Lachnospiraceae bacterium]
MSDTIDKPMREISVEGCDLIGKGGNGAVYRLNDETIVKVYFGERNSPEKIKRNRENTKNAFVQGVPTMIAFDMVKVGENYGVIYEMINARSFAEEISANPDKTDEYAEMIVDTLIKLHHTEFEPGALPDSKERYRNEVQVVLDKGYYKPAEADRLFEMVDRIPVRNTFIHQDFHPGNIMLSNGEVMLIDVDDSGLGHPIFDLAGMYLVYVTAAKTKWKTVDMGITREQFARIWDIVLMKYFGTTSRSELDEINRIIEGYSLVNMIKGVATSPSVPNIIRRPVIYFSKRKLFKALDILHPIP